VPSPLLVEDHPVDGGHLRLLRMHRPHARNAMDTALLVALVEALDAAATDPDVRGLLLTGGGGVFSAGADLREPLDDGGRRRMELFTAFYEQLSNFPRPTAAAVEGPAVGGGAEAAAACDLRAAGKSARFRFPGAVYGIPVGAARTVGLVGLSTAKDWVLSSRDVAAGEAADAGFVQRLVDDGEAEAAARAWLELVASRDAGTVALLKQTFNDFAGLRDRVAYENDALRAQAETGRLPAPGSVGGLSRKPQRSRNRS
jgi:enoyl-CoA hydratase/carnithine racemase